MPLLSNLLSREDFGVIGLFMIAMNLFTPIIGLSMNSIISRSFHVRNDLDELLGSAIILILFLASLVCFLLMVMPNGIFLLFGLDKFIALMALLSACFLTISVTFLALLQMQKRPLHWGIATTINTLVSVAVTFYLIFFFDLDYMSRLIGIILGQISAVCACYYFVRRSLKIKISIKLEHYIYFRNLGIPLLFTALSGWAIISLDRVFVNSFLGIQQTGLYVFAITLASPVYILQDVCSRVWSPNAFKMLAERDIYKLTRMLCYCYFGYLIFGSSFAIISPTLYRLVIGQEFFEALMLMPWIVFSITVQGLQNLLMPFILHSGKLRILGYSGGVALIINISINLLLIPLFDIMGAIVSSILTQLFISLIYLTFFIKKFSSASLQEEHKL